MKTHVIVPGYCVAMLVHTGIRGGMIVGSTYLEQGLGLGGANASKISRLGEYLSYYAFQFAVAGDWDVSLETLRKSDLPRFDCVLTLWLGLTAPTGTPRRATLRR